MTLVRLSPRSSSLFHKISSRYPFPSRSFSSSPLPSPSSPSSSSSPSFPSSSASLSRICFIGCGNMGTRMATNLLKAGHSLTLYDVHRPNAERLKQHLDFGPSVVIASSPRDAAEECPVVITMLPSSPHVVSVYCDSNGVLAATPKGRLLIDSSTIDPGTAMKVHAQAERMHCQMIDAPVSGGVGGAEQGTLTFMVGGSESAFAAAKPYLSKMGRSIVHCGNSGTGQIAKVCNNLVLGVSMAAVAEAMAIGVRLGADSAKLASIFNSSSARCWSSDTYNPVPGIMPNVPSSRDYEGGFGASLMIKDLGLAITAAHQAGVQPQAGQFALNMYQQLECYGWLNKDFSVLYKMLVEHSEKQTVN